MGFCFRAVENKPAGKSGSYVGRTAKQRCFCIAQTSLLGHIAIYIVVLSILSICQKHFNAECIYL